MTQTYFDSVSFSYLIGASRRNGFVILIWWNDFNKAFEQSLYDDVPQEQREEINKFLLTM